LAAAIRYFSALQQKFTNASIQRFLEKKFFTPTFPMLKHIRFERYGFQTEFFRMAVLPSATLPCKKFFI
ncbi:MAG: hypothetical protein RR504_05005, partial [Christensenellaceae bacterium]